MKFFAFSTVNAACSTISCEEFLLRLILPLTFPFTCMMSSNSSASISVVSNSGHEDSIFDPST